MYDDDNNNVSQEFQENEQSDIEIVREKYESRSQKADEIIAVQAVICILITAIFFTANIFYPQVCHELYDILQKLVKDTEHIVPYISDYV